MLTLKINVLKTFGGKSYKCKFLINRKKKKKEGK